MLLIISILGLSVIYCSSIHKFPEIQNGAELDYVFEIVRHGARTPYDNAEKFSEPA
jgi:hypothetical protein